MSQVYKGKVFSCVRFVICMPPHVKRITNSVDEQLCDKLANVIFTEYYVYTEYCTYTLCDIKIYRLHACCQTCIEEKPEELLMFLFIEFITYLPLVLQCSAYLL